MKVKYVGLMLFSCCRVIYANSIMDDFLQVERDSLVNNFKLQESSLEYIEKLRVDTEYKEDEEGSAQESISVRLYPKNFERYDLEKENLNHRQNHLNHNMQRERVRLQEEHYGLLVDAKFQKKMVDFLDKSIALYQNELHLKQKLMDGKFYVESIFFMKHKVELLKLKRQREEQRYKGSVHTIALTLNGRYSLDKIENAIESYRLIDSSSLISKIDEVDFITLRDAGIDKKIKRLKSNLIEEELRLEEMKSEFRLDFIEAGYKNRENHGNSFSVGVGVDLPLKHSNQLNIIKEKLALAELAQKDKLEDEHYVRQTKLLVSEAKALYTYERSLEEMLNNDTFYKLYSQKEDADPRFILEVQEKNLNAEEELIEMKEKLHNIYLKLLVLTHGFNTTLSPIRMRES